MVGGCRSIPIYSPSLEDRRHSPEFPAIHAPRGLGESTESVLWVTGGVSQIAACRTEQIRSKPAAPVRTRRDWWRAPLGGRLIRFRLWRRCRCGWLSGRRSDGICDGEMGIMETTVTVDKAGRMVLPKEVRDELQLAPGDTLDLASDGGLVTLRPPRGPQRSPEKRP
jgi:AbrB family looped-hinge helix DNA binding protein